MPLGSIISAAGSIAGSLIGKSEDEAARGRSEYWNRKALDWSKEQFGVLTRSALQRKVTDAKRAGLHPLFALGAQAPGSVPFIPGQAPSGSHLGEGIRDAATEIGRGVSRGQRASREAARVRAEGRRADRVADAQVRGIEARAAADEAQALATLSTLRRAEQEANARQDIAKTYPLSGSKSGSLEPPTPLPAVGERPQPTLLSLPGGKKGWLTGPQADAEKFQEKYGELADWVFGPAMLWKDFWKNIEKQPSTLRFPFRFKWKHRRK